MRNRIYFLLYVVLLIVPSIQARTTVKVIADRVNLRSGSSLDSEVVSQVSKGDVLVATDIGDSWVEVIPPSTIGFWVYSELILEGEVAVPKLKVRSGPGINYKSVGNLTKGSKVEAKGQKGDWLKITAPQGSRLWISRQFVDTKSTKEIKTRKTPRYSSSSRPKDVSKPPMPNSKINLPSKPSYYNKTVEPTVKNTQPSRSTYVPVVATTVANTGPPPAEKLVPTVLQGKIVSYEGSVKKAGIVWRRPSKYRLVTRDIKGRAITTCYLLGNSKEILALLDQAVSVSGREYWVQGVKDPVVVVDSVINN